MGEMIRRLNEQVRVEINYIGIISMLITVVCHRCMIQISCLNYHYMHAVNKYSNDVGYIVTLPRVIFELSKNINADFGIATKLFNGY